jgi:tRNA (uracil-5-)-methyltransferase TRM9
MDNTTIQRLNQINQRFYQITAQSFDESRGQPWPGWERLLPYLDTPLGVLDVGCGNGRFGVFLADRLGPAAIRYYGLDNNPVLLDRARAALSGLEAQLEQRDIVTQPPDSGSYDLVVLFGMLHHIPGAQHRRDVMQSLAQRVAPGGLLAFAAWRFYDYARFRERIVPWSDDIEVERHDYLLDWRRGERALRYCHFVDDDEHAALIAATGLAEVETYRADGRTNDANHYSILRRSDT